MTPPGRRRVDVHLVALVLAIALAIAVALLGAAVLANVIGRHNPAATLGENTTQVLTAIVGGLVGILGGYIGYQARPPGDR